MDSDQIESALARINSAVSRLEKAAKRPAQALQELESRHEILRAAVVQSLTELDGLIDGQKS